MKGLEEEGSLLEETPQKGNLHSMVTKRDERRKGTWCASSARSCDIKYDCPLYKSQANKRKKKAMMATWSESEMNHLKKKMIKKWQTCAS